MRRLNYRIRIVLFAVAVLLAAGTPVSARTVDARPTPAQVSERAPAKSSSWLQRFIQMSASYLRARYAMAAN